MNRAPNQNNTQQNIWGSANEGVFDQYQGLVRLAELDIQLSIAATAAGMVATLALEDQEQPAALIPTTPSAPESP